MPTWKLLLNKDRSTADEFEEEETILNLYKPAC